MKLYKNHHFWYAISLLLVNGLFFTAVDASKAPSILFIVGFLLVAASLYLFFTAVLWIIESYGLSFKHRRKRVAACLTAYSSGLLAMQSIGQLSPRDVLVVTLIALLAYFYVSYGQKQTS